MKLKIPPVLMLFVFAGFMLLLDRYLPVGEYHFLGRNYLAAACVVGGLIICALAIFQFSRAGTTSNPMSPTDATRLVTHGIYKYSRNPMYLSMLLLLVALGLKLGNAFNTITAAFFVAYMNKFQIFPEEEALTAVFGKKYQQYLLQVRRWF